MISHVSFQTLAEIVGAVYARYAAVSPFDELPHHFAEFAAFVVVHSAHLHVRLEIVVYHNALSLPVQIFHHAPPSFAH